MTKIDIISGFLGAGKTTLIKKLIDGGYTNEKLVLIENEFGEIGIDGGFLKDSGIQISEMNSGCICCSLVGDFKKALKDVIETYTPDRIIIEPSGVGKLSDVIRAVEAVASDTVQLNSFNVVVDAMKCKMYIKNFGEFFLDQVEHASCIILSRSQMMNEKKLLETVELLREHNHDAAVITTPWEEIEAKTILSAMEHSHSLVDEVLLETEEHHHHDDEDEEEEHHHHHDHEEDEHHHHHDDDDGDDDDCCCGHDHDHEGHEHHHHHHADDVFTSFGVETPKKFEKETLETALKALAAEDNGYGQILRSKGILEGTDGTWYYFDLTPGEYEIRTGAADYTGKLCVIGSKLDEKKIQELFGLS